MNLALILDHLASVESKLGRADLQLTAIVFSPLAPNELGSHWPEKKEKVAKFAEKLTQLSIDVARVRAELKEFEIAPASVGELLEEGKEKAVHRLRGGNEAI